MTVTLYTSTGQINLDTESNSAEDFESYGLNKADYTQPTIEELLALIAELQNQIAILQGE